MLENSNLVQGKSAKEVDKLLKEYEDITIKLADLDKSKKEVLTRLFELTEVGTNETSNYVFNIVMNKGRETIGVKKLRDNNHALYEIMESEGYLSVGEPFKTVRGIKLKGNRS